MQGWKLTCHKAEKRDKRDDGSAFVMIHSENKEGQLWRLESEGNGKYRIKYATDDYGMKGWKLTSHRFYPEKDDRDKESTYIMIHKDTLEGDLFNFEEI